MKLALAFHAQDEADATAQAHAWAEAEPNVESHEVTAAAPARTPEHWPPTTRWTVTVQLVFREAAQPTLGLVA